MKEKQITQAYLIENGYCTKTTISRICRNRNDKGMSYSPTPRIIMTLALVFKLTPKQVKELFDIAYPEFEKYKLILENNMTLEEVAAP